MTIYMEQPAGKGLTHIVTLRRAESLYLALLAILLTQELMVRDPSGQ